MKGMPISKIKKAHKGHWFDKEAMRFFGTRIIDYNTNRHGMFITEEKADFAGERRAFNLRMYVPEQDDIITIGDYLQFPTLQEARSFKRAVSKALDKAGNREKHVLSRLVRAEWNESGFLVFEADDGTSFDVSVEREEIVG